MEGRFVFEMCGICGKINFNLDRKVDENLIYRMTRIMKYRGPDDEGYYFNKNIGLGMCRLSIIDLETGHQPIHNEDKSIWVILNGEIYNFLDLRKNLEENGHNFYTRSDAETLVHLYEEMGEDCLKKLRGMFAFAIWDNNKERLFIARDRLGKKPLFYSKGSDGFIFASELKCILEDRHIKRNLDLKSMDLYLTYQYVPAPRTIFIGIEKLPPAHYLIYEKGKVSIKKYWDLDFSAKENLAEEEICERMMEILKEAVKLRLISDVPLGAFLSGGMDSSTVVGLMAENSSKPVKTFSIGFSEKSYDELKYAKIVADYFGTEHREFIVKPDVIEILPKLVWHYDEPYADSSMIPTYYVAMKTREHVKVALNGDGGDENFGGYERYLAYLIGDYYTKVPLVIRDRIISPISNKLPQIMPNMNFFKRAKRFVAATSLSTERRYENWISIFPHEMKNDLYSDEFKQKLGKEIEKDYIINWFKRANGNTSLDNILYVDIHSYLPEDLLVKMDRACMAVSLEARAPFLDHQMLEFSAKISSGMKVKRLETKHILKKAVKNFLPIEVIKREKQGFGVPVGIWFKKELKSLTEDILLDKRIVNRRYFDIEFVKKILNEHHHGIIDHAHRIWALLTLEIWHRIFIDGNSIENIF